MLEACDRLGMLVMDEAFDMWTSAKNDFDYSLNFSQWERDIEAMVAKDVNHPSVIVYSIGNEIPETGTPAGAACGRRLAGEIATEQLVAAGVPCITVEQDAGCAERLNIAVNRADRDPELAGQLLRCHPSAGLQQQEQG
jgi:hypothetical protein